MSLGLKGLGITIELSTLIAARILEHARKSGRETAVLMNQLCSLASHRQFWRTSVAMVPGRDGGVP